MPDDVLATAWRAGDRGAGDALMRRYYANVRRFFDLRVPALADDMTQQTFAELAQQLRVIELQRGVRAYLFGIARKQLLRHLRKQGRHERAVRLAEEDSTARTSLSVVAARREEEVLLLMALSTLPTDLQIAVNLYYWETMTTIEIGEVLEVNPSTIGSRLARARELLVEAIVDMTRPGRLRDDLVAQLEEVHRGLGPTTAAANAGTLQR